VRLVGRALAVAAAVGIALQVPRHDPRPTGTGQEIGITTPRPNGPLWLLDGPGATSIAGGGVRVRRYDVTTGTSRLVPIHAPPDALWSVHQFGVSPADSSLVFATSGGEFPPRNIAIARGDGSDLHLLTTGPYEEISPSFLPNGQTVVFASDRATATASSTGTYEVYTIARDGTNLNRVTHGTGHALLAAAGPNGMIAYERVLPGADAARAVHVVYPDGSDDRTVATFDGHHHDPMAIAWAADGRSLFIATDGSNPAERMVDRVAIDGTTPTVTTVHRCRDRCSAIAASPDGQSFAVLEGWPHLTVTVVDLTTGEERTLPGVEDETCCMVWQPAEDR
jgi:WD40 repeat protein